MLIAACTFLALLTGVGVWATERVDRPKRRAARIAQATAAGER